MRKRAFDKIRAGLDSARSYLDGSADKTAYRANVPTINHEIGRDVEAVPVRKAKGPHSTAGKPGPARRV